MSYEHDDLLAALARANPVSSAAVDRRATRAADDLFERIVSGGRPRRDRRLVLAVAVAILAVGLLAFAVVEREQPTKPLGGVVCHGTLDLTTDRFVSFEAGDAIAVCTDAWERGLVGDGPVPNLSACILETGVIGVFPGESGTTCERLGLPSALERDTDIVSFGRDLAMAVGAECIGADEAIAVVEAKFAEWGMDGWVVSLGAGPPFTADSCATVGIDQERREVSIIAIPFDPNR